MTLLEGRAKSARLSTAASRGPDLISVFSTAELARRQSRRPDPASERRTAVALAQVMAVSPEGILQRLAETALALCGAQSAGISLLTEDRNSFYWPAIAGHWASHIGGGTPRDFGPCGTVLDRNTALMFRHPEQDFPYFGEVAPLVEEALLMPFYIDEEAVGTIWVVTHDECRRFDCEDLRVMTNLGMFAAAAYQNLLSISASQRIGECADDAIERKGLDGDGKDFQSETTRPLIGTVAFSEFVMSQCATAAQNAESVSAAQRHHCIARAVACMAREPFRSYTVAGLAAVAGMSRSSFAQCFTTTFGLPPIDYLKAERLRVAANLLSTTLLPVKVIANKIGYVSVSYFSRSFNTAIGMSPSAVRAQAISKRVRATGCGNAVLPRTR